MEASDSHSSGRRVSGDIIDIISEAYPLKPAFTLGRALEWKRLQPYVALIQSPVLDLGCGDGRLSHVFWGNQKIIGLDMDESAVMLAKKIFPMYWKAMQTTFLPAPVLLVLFLAIVPLNIFEMLTRV